MNINGWAICLLFSVHSKWTHLQKILPEFHNDLLRSSQKGCRPWLWKCNLVKQGEIEEGTIVFQKTTYFPSTVEEKQFKGQAQPAPQAQNTIFPSESLEKLVFSRKWKRVHQLSEKCGLHQWMAVRWPQKNYFLCMWIYKCNSKVCFYVIKL